jgi:hypothetical protein
MNIICQISLTGFDKASEVSVVSSLLAALCIILFGVCVFLFRKFEDKVTEINQVRVDALKREESRNKEILESEKETLKVLNGVTAVLEISEKINEQDTDNIIRRIVDESDKIKRRIDDLEVSIKKQRK